VLIRPYRGSDLPQVYELAATSLRERYDPEIFISIPQYWPEGFMVAEEMGAIIGFVFGVTVSRSEGRILMLAVAQRYRGLGLGTELCKRFFQECSKRGLGIVSLEVRETNSVALHFYERLGFTITNRMEGYYSDKEAGLQLMAFL
jgi:ribosomal protein S18 acetylase RimI-like enzyme